MPNQPETSPKAPPSADTRGGGPIHVALTFDDNFWAPAFAVMRSACLSTKRRKDLVFHLCVVGISPEHRRDLDVIASEFGATQIYYELEGNPAFDRILKTLKTNRRFPHVTYTRLVLDRILPETVTRVIYLDSDTLVLAPIERLYEQDMHGHPIAAVADPFGMHIMMGRDMRAKAGIFDAAEPYFNSGVLLIDLPAYRAADIPARIEEFRDRDILRKLYYDQDMLNLIFAGRWHQLEWRYNTIAPARAQQAIGPYIVHYTGDVRPWHLVTLLPYHHLYRHTMTNELFYRFMRHRWKLYWLKRLDKLLGRK